MRKTQCYVLLSVRERPHQFGGEGGGEASLAFAMLRMILQKNSWTPRESLQESTIGIGVACFWNQLSVHMPEAPTKLLKSK